MFKINLMTIYKSNIILKIKQLRSLFKFKIINHKKNKIKVNNNYIPLR